MVLMGSTPPAGAGSPDQHRTLPPQRPRPIRDHWSPARRRAGVDPGQRGHLHRRRGRLGRSSVLVDPRV